MIDLDEHARLINLLMDLKSKAEEALADAQKGEFLDVRWAASEIAVMAGTAEENATLLAEQW
ncbi:hypothetical protein [Actinomadura sp. WMMB 499]|uniref:hypothetical protein n=1 Tax=Actinomadura sp. WMMB 499 TaxID=1219491 RepID=UPI0012493B4D|nr:hypothetical protein [Actinomadura sp. WMMB 499]QFG25432.1 hypothetical protein F7P10_34010 [Actinomadura sp. WMMB 499]